MIYVLNNNDSCFFNHAAEEYLMNNFDDEVFMLWINKPSILIGRNQNTISEVNSDYIRENGIEVVRRLSGGGAVYNDHGNMNFTFISKRDKTKGQIKDGFEKFALPVINGLQSLGVDAVFTGRNDIVIDGKKFSGNAQYFQKEKMLHHGTLLFDCDMSKLSLALKSKPIKFIGKSVKSVGSRVTNILPHLEKPMSLDEFREYLKNYIMDTHDIEDVYEFNKTDLDEIEKIANDRFKKWEWNYGKFAKYRYENAVKYPSGVIEYNLDVEEGIINRISIFGDFFGEGDIRELELLLVGMRHSMLELEEGLKDIKIENYIKGISTKQFIDGLLDI